MKRNKVIILYRIGIYVLFGLLFMFGVVTVCSAQTWGTYKGIRMVNNSDTTQQLPIQGSIFFDDVQDKFYGYDGIGWKPFGLGGDNADYWKTSGTTQLKDANVFINPLGDLYISDTTNTAISFRGNSVGNFISLQVGNSSIYINPTSASGANSIIRGNPLNPPGALSKSHGLKADSTNAQLSAYVNTLFIDGSDFHNYVREVTVNVDTTKVSIRFFRTINNIITEQNYDITETGMQFPANIIAPNLPSSCTGQPSGTIWNDAGTLKVCP